MKTNVMRARRAPARAKYARWILAAAVSFPLVLTGAIGPVFGSPPNPEPDPKVAEASHGLLPIDITGDAAAAAERDTLRGALRSLVEFDGGTVWNPDSQILTIQMTSEAALDRAREMVTNIGTALQVKFVRVAYTAKELDALSNQLLGNQLQWAGATGIGGGYDPASNRVLLQVDAAYKDAPLLINAIEKLNDPRVTLQPIQAVEDWQPESRVDDFSPWSAGATIDGSLNLCTLGWTWKLWANNQVVGSTAQHCDELNWYNNGTYVGTVFKSSVPNDSVLMSGGGYSPTVFVGDQTTSVVRRVVSVDTSWSVGDSVAMSGRTTGLNVTTVRMPTYTLPSCANEYAGLVGVLMASHVTANGDSGGPWLTTQSGTGYAVAHGQHFGSGCATSYAGSFFMKLNSISSAQGASILLS